ncbi:flagellar hook protein FlgE [Syntrophomonas erecta]
MMRSMFTAVSGLRNHQLRMDVIGNNIANVNTAGYKKSRVLFKDTLYQNMRGASRPADGHGGTNPMAVGLGMAVGSIDQIHTPFSASTTNKITDLAVDGNGYFIVENGGQKFYTRAGNFDFDKMGNLVQTSNGYLVHGWMADEKGVIDTVRPSQPIDISGFKSVPPRATTEMRFSGNLYSDLDIPQINTAAPGDPVNNVNVDPANSSHYPTKDEEVVITSKEVFDSLGNKQTVYFRFFKTGYVPGDPTADPPIEPMTNWACDISLDSRFNETEGYDPAAHFQAIDMTNPTAQEDEKKIIRVYNLQFNEQGKINDSTKAGVTLNINRSSQGADDIEFEVDFSQLTQWETRSSATADYQDGYSMGNLTSFTIGIDGTIHGVYDNGTARSLAQVALVNFQNPSGLLQAGNNLFQVSTNSGDPVVGVPGGQGMGALIPGSLEMSNVDLSEEFTDMIVTQRGFQANSRVITTSDEMLQELVNLKR